MKEKGDYTKKKQKGLMKEVAGNTHWGEKPKSLQHNTEFGVVAPSFN